MILSILIGIGIGIIYGFSFLIMGKKTRTLSGKQLFFISILATIIRLGSLAALLIFLLQLQGISSMLVIISLLITFWIIIAK